MEGILLSTPFLVGYGFIIGMVLNWFVKHAKETPNKYDDLGADTLIFILKRADEFFDGTPYEDLTNKALELIIEDPAYNKSQENQLKSTLEKVAKK